MRTHSPPSHQVSRYLLALLLIAAFAAAVYGLHRAGADTRLVGGARRVIEEVRRAWKG